MHNNLVTVIHGANDGDFPVDGKTIATVMASLVDAFNIPNDAIAFLNGAKVEFSTVLSGGDVLEFVRVAGEKGAGELLTSEELMARWEISKARYEEYLEWGLPFRKHLDGSFVHSEFLAIEWAKTLGANHNRSMPSATETISLEEDANWCYQASPDPTSLYRWGYLEGCLKQLASWLHPEGKPDSRHIRTRARNKGIWVQAINSRLYRIWFDTEEEYERARRKKEQSE